MRTSTKPGLTYAPALDGLRALCVAAVILYHADLAWMPGGFLGVEVFFVLSGFLITSLLRNELATTGRIDLLEFWKRRARRLLPALWVLLAAVSLYAACFLPGELWRLRSEVLAGFAYVANWYFSFANYSYFEVVGRPSLLTHLWSLAIEEQFYLLWPGLFYVASKRLSAGKLGLASLVLAVVSAAWMAWRFTPGVDPSAIYYDSAARAAAILLGAAMAFLASERIPRLPAVAADVLGWGGVLGLVAACVFYGEADAFVFRGGLIVVDLCALAVIVASVHPRARTMQRLLSLEPLRLIGTRSYGLYLWHWPVAALTRPGIDIPLGVTSALVLRLVLAGVLAELSYRLIEVPVRKGGFLFFTRAFRGEAKLRKASRLRRLTLATGLGAMALGFAFVAQAFILATPPAPASFEPDATAPEKAWIDNPGALASVEQPPPAEVDKPAGTRPARVARNKAQPPTPLPEPMALLFGDSVMKAASRYLRAGYGAEVALDAEIGRTASTALPALRKLAKARKLPAVVILHLGDNGWLWESQVHEIMAVLEDVEHVVFINVHVPKRWQDRNNAALAAALARYPRVTLIDWAKASERHREWFGVDGLHLTHAGAQAFTALVTPHYRRKPRD